MILQNKKKIFLNFRISVIFGNKLTHLIFGVHLFLHHDHQKQHKKDVNALVQQRTYEAKFTPKNNRKRKKVRNKEFWPLRFGEIVFIKSDLINIIKLSTGGKN